MDFAHSGDGSSDEVSSNTGKGKEHFHRHSTEQIEQLEAFFKDCPHPTKDQRQQLSSQLGLSYMQIKFWFQNKRNQLRYQHERADNDALRAENQKLRMENYTLKGILMDPFCATCDGGDSEEETRQIHLQALRIENIHLKKQLDGLVSLFARLQQRRGL